MGYYDNVKDSIRDENDESSKEESSDSSSGINGNFDTLKEAAEETQVEDEEGGDGTPIEVLEEDGLKKEAPSESRNQSQQKSQKQSRSQRQEQQSRKKPQTENRNTQNTQNSNAGKSSGQALSGDTSDLEDKLDKIIEQNSRMIEILESFGN